MILNRWCKTLAGSALAAFLVCAPAALSNTITGSQTLSANVGAIGKLSVVQSSLSLTHTGTTFADFTAPESVQYKVRTTISTGSASLTVQATADFAPAGGPAVSSGNLFYTCSGASLG